MHLPLLTKRVTNLPLIFNWQGLAELTVQPLNNKLTNIRINCRQCSKQFLIEIWQHISYNDYINLEIEKAFVNDIPVDFEYNDAVSDLTLGANTSISHHQVYKSRYMNALRDADEGELIVKLPADCINQVNCRFYNWKCQMYWHESIGFWKRSSIYQ